MNVSYVITADNTLPRITTMAKNKYLLWIGKDYRVNLTKFTGGILAIGNKQITKNKF